MKTLKSFEDIISHYEAGNIGQIHGPGTRVEFALDIDGEQFNVYDGWLNPSWITLYADEGVVEYVVDNCPNGNTYELFSITDRIWEIKE